MAFAMLAGCAETAGVEPPIQTEAVSPQRVVAQGCSASGEPMKGAVEQAAGVVALIALVLGLRRRFGRRDDAQNVDRPRERYYSIP